MQYIAFCTKGLEELVKEEISEVIKGVRFEELGPKRIVFETNADIHTLRQLKTVDDLCLFLQKKENIQDFIDVIDTVLTVDFEHVRQKLKKWRDLTNFFSLTVGTANVKKFSSQSLIQKLPELMMKKYQWNFTPLDHTNFDIRIFIDQTTVYVCV